MSRYHRLPVYTPPAHEGYFAVRWRLDCGTTAAGPEPKFHKGMKLPSYYRVDQLLGPYPSYQDMKDAAAGFDEHEADPACFWGWSEVRLPQFPRTDTDRRARNPVFVVNGPWDTRHPMVRLASKMAQSGRSVVVGR